jgi:alginate O-acetyltransferase complex protein AlgI
MVFVSDSFVFVFLPVFLIAYAAIPTALRNFTILAFSLVFYGWWRFDFLPLLVGISCWSWSTGLWISRAAGRGRRQALLAGIAPPICSLIYFKYANLLAESAANLGVSIEGWTAVPLPIGLSFFVFGAISYSVDVFRRTVAAETNMISYSTYQAMFGHLVAGPIVRYQSVARRLQSRVFDIAEFAEGWRRFMLGFSQKVLIADTLAPLVDAGYSLPSLSSSDAIVTTVAFTLHLYFDFSGYSSMAIGLGLMVGLKFPENFANPYLSTSLAEFWRRWHISLSSWLRDYLYIPLGGNRVARVRSNLNLLITMALGGLWHGASWTFLIWGFWHGIGLVAGRIWTALRLPAISPVLGHTMTIVFVMAGWILFRAQDWQAAGTMFRGVIGSNGFPISAGFAAAVRPIEILTLGLGIVIIYLPVLEKFSLRASVAIDRPPFALAAMLWLWSLWVIQNRTVIPFLYFQF